MTTANNLPDLELPVVDCWNRIGVHGDHSCPELATVIHCHNCPVFRRAGQRLFDRPPPPECVDEWTDRLAREEFETPGEMVALLVFRVGDEWLALDVRALVEVTGPRRVHGIPHRRERALLGIVNIRGELQLCLSLRELLGAHASKEASEQTRRTGWLLVAEHGGQRWVLAVDEVAGVQRVPLVEISEAPATVRGSHASAARGVFVSDARRIGCLDADRLFEMIRRGLG